MGGPHWHWPGTRGGPWDSEVTPGGGAARPVAGASFPADRRVLFVRLCTRRLSAQTSLSHGGGASKGA